MLPNPLHPAIVHFPVVLMSAIAVARRGRAYRDLSRCVWFLHLGRYSSIQCRTRLGLMMMTIATV